MSKLVAVLTLAAVGIFSDHAPAFGRSQDQPKAAAQVEPALEITAAWYTPSVRFGLREVQPSDGHALLVVAVRVKNGVFPQTSDTEFNTNFVPIGLSLSYANGVKVRPGAARLSDAKGAQIEPLGVVVGGGMAFFKPGWNGLSKQVNVGDLPAQHRDKSFSLLLIFDAPKEAAGLQLTMGTSAPMPVPSTAPAKP